MNNLLSAQQHRGRIKNLVQLPKMDHVPHGATGNLNSIRRITQRIFLNTENLRSVVQNKIQDSIKNKIKVKLQTKQSYP